MLFENVVRREFDPRSVRTGIEVGEARELHGGSWTVVWTITAVEAKGGQGYAKV